MKINYEETKDAKEAQKNLRVLRFFVVDFPQEKETMKQPASSIAKQTLCAAISIILVALSAASASAQSADKIIKQAVKAMTNGKGEKALREIRSWRIKGTITDLKDGSSGGYRAAAAQPDLYIREFDLRGVEVSIGYNGKSAWMRDSRDGLRTLTGDASRDFQTEARYRNARWLDYKKERSKLSFGGQTTVQGKPANTVILTTVKNVKIKLYFDAASGLLVREETPAGEIARVLDYSDFRPVGNLMEPHSIICAEGDERYEIKLDQVVHNPQIDRAAFEFPKTSGEALPDIPALLNEVGKNEDEIDRLLEKYTYTETITKRELDSNGQMKSKESETFELTFYKGARIRRLVARNGKPLSPKEAADAQKDVEKRIREIEKKETEKERKEREAAQKASKNPDAKTDRDPNGDSPNGDPPNGDSEDERKERPSIADVLRASRLLNPRRERFRSRDVIVFDFEPLPGYKPKKNYEKLFGKMAGALWIDPKDKQVARVEARLVEAYKIGGGMLASLKEGANFTLEQERVNQEIWLPTRAEINLGVRVLLLKGLNINQTITYGDYKRFSVEAEKEKLKDPSQSEKEKLKDPSQSDKTHKP
jgi:outer membrane lipoprotein-sorting protein